MADYQLHIVVRGRVQGVYFRAFTREQAQLHGLRGWAKNQPDGSVDILLSGPRPAVLGVRDRLRQGPPAAQVQAMDSEEVNWEAGLHFDIS